MSEQPSEREPSGQEPSEQEPQREQYVRRNKKGEPVLVFPVPKNLIYATVAVVVFSLIVTFFVRNPYTQATSEGSLYYERGIETNLAIWVAIFIGIPASFLAYKHWILPMIERRMNQRR